MRTMLFLAAGFMLMGGFLLVGKLFGEQFPASTRLATLLFAAIWLIVAVVNMSLGVTRAGYSVAEELPIFLLIFAVPVIVAAVLKWQLL